MNKNIKKYKQDTLFDNLDKRVSIITLTFNHCDYLKNLYNSLLKTTLNLDWEWIVGDAGTDGTDKFLQNLKDRRIRVFKVDNNNFASNKTRNQSASYVSQMIREMGGLVVIPHPCTPFFSMRRSVIKQISPDAIEVYNAHSPCFARDARQSRELARQLKITMVAGSDSHTWQTVGDAYTLIDATADIDSILHAIRLGHTSIGGSASRWRYRLPFLTWRRARQLHKTIQHQVVTPSTSKV